MRNGPGMMGMMDRPPMTREEFMEVQERQRQERHRQHRMMDHSERSVVLIIPILSEVRSVLLLSLCIHENAHPPLYLSWNVHISEAGILTTQTYISVMRFVFRRFAPCFYGRVLSPLCTS